MPSLKKNIIYSILLTASQVVFSLAVLPYVTRILGPHNIGRVAFADSVTQYFIIIASLGIPIYGVREISKYKYDKVSLSKLFVELMTIVLMFTGLLSLIYAILISFIDNFRQDHALFYLGFIQLIFSCFVFEWFFQGLEDFKFIAVRTFVVRAISVVGIFFLVKNKTDSVLYYGIITFASVGNAILNLITVRTQISVNLKSLELKKHIKPILTFFSTRFVTSIYVIFLTIVLGFLAAKEDVAYFSSAYKIYTVTLTFIVAFSSVLIPRLSEYISKNMLTESIALISKSFHVICTFGIPVVVCTIVFSKQIILILLGDKFQQAQMDLILLSPLVLIISISNLFAMNVLTPHNKERLFLRSTFLGMLLSLLLMFLLIPAFHDVGAAITLLLTECFICVLLGYYSFSFLKGFSIDLKAILLNLITSVTIFGLTDKFIGIIRLSVIYQFIIAMVVSGFVFTMIQSFVLKNSIMVEIAEMLKRKVLRRDGYNK